MLDESIQSLIQILKVQVSQRAKDVGMVSGTGPRVMDAETSAARQALNNKTQAVASAFDELIDSHKFAIELKKDMMRLKELRETKIESEAYKDLKSNIKSNAQDLGSGLFNALSPDEGLKSLLGKVLPTLGSAVKAGFSGIMGGDEKLAIQKAELAIQVNETSKSIMMALKDKLDSLDNKIFNASGSILSGDPTDPTTLGTQGDSGLPLSGEPEDLLLILNQSINKNTESLDAIVGLIEGIYGEISDANKRAKRLTADEDSLLGVGKSDSGDGLVDNMLEAAGLSSLLKTAGGLALGAGKLLLKVAPVLAAAFLAWEAFDTTDIEKQRLMKGYNVKEKDTGAADFWGTAALVIGGAAAALLAVPSGGASLAAFAAGAAYVADDQLNDGGVRTALGGTMFGQDSPMKFGGPGDIYDPATLNADVRRGMWEEKLTNLVQDQISLMRLQSETMKRTGQTIQEIAHMTAADLLLQKMQTSGFLEWVFKANPDVDTKIPISGGLDGSIYGMFTDAAGGYGGGSGLGGASPSGVGTPHVSMGPATAGYTGAAAKVSGDMNAKALKAHEYFVSKGWTPEQASGIVGNLMYESGLRTGAEGDKGFKGGSSFGVAQWREGRLKEFHKRYGKNVWEASYEEQLEFVDWELKNTHASAGRRLAATTNSTDATGVVNTFYEGSRDGSKGIHHKRLPYTKAIENLVAAKANISIEGAVPISSGELVAATDAAKAAEQSLVNTNVKPSASLYKPSPGTNITTQAQTKPAGGSASPYNAHELFFGWLGAAKISAGNAAH